MRSMKGVFFSTWVFRYHHCKYRKPMPRCFIRLLRETLLALKGFLFSANS